MLWYTSQLRTITLHRTCITCGQNLVPQMLRAIFCRGGPTLPWIIVGWECLKHPEEGNLEWPVFPDTKQLALVPRMAKWGYQNNTPFTGFCKECGRGVGMEQTYMAAMRFDGRKWVVDYILCHSCGLKDGHTDRKAYLSEEGGRWTSTLAV